MARYNTTVQCNKPRQEVFDYLADFANAAEWDPGVVSGENLTGKPIEQGSTFRLMCRYFGRQFPLEYRITAFEAPSRVVFEANRGSISSVDEIRFVTDGEGASVTYEANLRLKGPLGRLIDPLIALAFQRIGGKAAAGLRRTLNGCESPAEPRTTSRVVRRRSGGPERPARLEAAAAAVSTRAG